MQKTEKKQMLIFAYACEPNMGSEPGVGWNWSIELSKYYDVVVITRENNKKSIEADKKSINNSSLHFIYYDVPKKLTFWKKGQKGLYLYYYLWQMGAVKVARKCCPKPDYVMSLTFGNLWLPSLAYKIKGNFIWGPLGGGEGVPNIWLNKMSLKQRIFERIRGINKRFPITNPWFFSACKKAKLIIVRTPDTLKCIPQKYLSKCMVCIETGVTEEDIRNYKEIQLNKEENQINYACIGKLVPYKQIDIAIRAFSLIAKGDNVGLLHIVGSGPEDKKLKSLANELEIKNHVIFHGKVSRDESLNILSQCDALLMPSAREGGSWVMFEAMLLKKPIICFDTSGMSVVETNETAVLLPVKEYSEAVDDFSEAMMLLATNKKLSNEMGEKAFERVSTCLRWNNHIEQMQQNLFDIENV